MDGSTACSSLVRVSQTYKLCAGLTVNCGLVRDSSSEPFAGRTAVSFVYRTKFDRIGISAGSA